MPDKLKDIESTTDLTAWAKEVAPAMTMTPRAKSRTLSSRVTSLAKSSQESVSQSEYDCVCSSAWSMVVRIGVTFGEGEKRCPQPSGSIRRVTGN